MNKKIFKVIVISFSYIFIASIIIWFFIGNWLRTKPIIKNDFTAEEMEIISNDLKIKFKGANVFKTIKSDDIVYVELIASNLDEFILENNLAKEEDIGDIKNNLYPQQKINEKYEAYGLEGVVIRNDLNIFAYNIDGIYYIVIDVYSSDEDVFKIAGTGKRDLMFRWR